jgi:hypothetical protein
VCLVEALAARAVVDEHVDGRVRHVSEVTRRSSGTPLRPCYDPRATGQLQSVGACNSKVREP